MPSLTVIAANLHNSRDAVRWLRNRSRADSPEPYDLALLSEAHKRRLMLRGFPGHTYRTGGHRGPSQETGILVGNHLTELGHAYEFLSAEAPKFPSVGKERWGQSSVITFGNTEIAAVTYHPVAGPRALHGSDPDHPLVRRYAKATRWLDATVTFHRSLGREVIVGSDCQMVEKSNRLWSPKHVFAENDMAWEWHGIDVVAWTPGLAATGPASSRVRRDFPSDHPALVVRLNLRRK
jgi:hypothetical protein